VKRLAETFSIIEVAVRSGIFRSFTHLLEGSPLEQELNGEATYTLFAPAETALFLILITVDHLEIRREYFSIKITP
jgi:hypothetical protein